MKQFGTLLIVDDNSDVLQALRLLLKPHAEAVRTEDNPEMIPGLVSSENYDAILLDMNFTQGKTSGEEGINWLKKILEIDPETGEVELQRYIAVDDVGNVINPMIVEGQIQGGIAQGVGQALWEQGVYDESGQLLTGSLMEYALPRAASFPKFEIGRIETPSPHNPLGVKGIGETGAIASTVTIYNAVIDALRPLGVTKIDMPLTPEKVWQAIRQQQGS